MKKKKIKASKLFPNFKIKKDFFITDIKPLYTAKKNELSFFDSVKYKADASTTKSEICITTSKLQEFLPKNIYKVIVKNVLFELAKTISKVYPNAHIDYPDKSLKTPKKSKFKNVKFGNNVLIGKNVKMVVIQL